MYYFVSQRYVIVYQKGYQEFDDVVSGTTTKVKGIAQTNYTALNMTGPGGLKFRIWDVADYVIPPQVVIIFAAINLFFSIFAVL